MLTEDRGWPDITNKVDEMLTGFILGIQHRKTQLEPELLGFYLSRMGTMCKVHGAMISRSTEGFYNRDFVCSKYKFVIYVTKSFAFEILKNFQAYAFLKQRGVVHGTTLRSS